MADNFSEQLLLLRADFTALNALLGSSFYDQQQSVLNTVEQVYDRLDEVGQNMQTMSQHIAATSHAARSAMTSSNLALDGSTSCPGA